MSTRLMLIAALVAGLALAGCESEPPPEPVPAEPPAETPAEKPPEETPAESAPPAADEKGLAWAVGQTPADANLVVAVASLADLEKNLKAMLGPDADEVEMVGGLAESLPPAAFDTAGPLVFILPSGMEEPEAVALLRIKDAAAIKGDDAGAGIVEMEVSGEAAGKQGSVFVLALDGWALVAEHKAEAIKAVMRAEKKLRLSDAQQAFLAKHDVWIHLNVPALAGLARGAMQKAQEQAAQQNPEAAKNMEASLKVMDWLLDVARDVTSLDVAGTVTADGIQAVVEGQFAEGSNLAAIAAAGADAPLTSFKAGLPVTEDLVLAAWGAMDWQKATPPMKALIKPLIDLAAEGQDEATAKAIQDMWASYEKWGGIMGREIALVLELPDPGVGIYQLAETFEIKDPEAYRALMKEYMDASSAFMDVMMTKFTFPGGMPGMGMQVPHVQSEASFNEAAETVAGVPVDVMRIGFKVNLPEGAPPEAGDQIRKMLETLYGPNGMEFRMAIVGNKGVATMGGKEVMARAVQAVKGEAPDLATLPQVAAAIKEVPKGEGLMLVSAANYMYMAMGMADKMMAQNFPPEILAEAEKAGHGPLAKPSADGLIRVTGTVEAAGIALTADVPASDLRAAVGLVKKFGERMQFLMQKQQEMIQKQQGQAQPQP
jgi:hypothetical protein